MKESKQEDISFELTNTIISTLSQISSLAKNEKQQSISDSTPPNPPPLPPPLPQLPKQLLEQQTTSVSNPVAITAQRSQSVKSNRPAPAVPTRAHMPVQTTTSPVDLTSFSYLLPAELTPTAQTEETTVDLQATEDNPTRSSSSNLTKKLASIATHESSSTASSSYSSSNSNVSLLHSSSSQESQKKALIDNADTAVRQQPSMSTFRSQQSNNNNNSSAASNPPSVSRQNSNPMTPRRNSSSQNSERTVGQSNPLPTSSTPRKPYIYSQVLVSLLTILNLTNRV